MLVINYEKKKKRVCLWHGNAETFPSFLIYLVHQNPVSVSRKMKSGRNKCYEIASRHPKFQLTLWYVPNTWIWCTIHVTCIFIQISIIFIIALVIVFWIHSYYLSSIWFSIYKRIILLWRFIIGFFLGAIPWYIGLFVLLCARIDYREKPGYIACTIAVSIFSVSLSQFCEGHTALTWL